MSNILKYKGYTGSVSFDAEDRIFHGRVTGIRDVVGFEGVSVDELEGDFRDAVDDYLDTCREIGKPPEKSFSGRIILEIPGELHASIATEADRQRKRVEDWIVDACRKMVKTG